MGLRILLSLSVLVGSLLALAPAPPASAQRLGQLTGNSYTDEIYGFSVSWDEDVFEGTEILGSDDVAYGIALVSESVTASITASAYEDVDECLDGRAQLLRSMDDVDSVKESRRLDSLAYDREPVSIVYEYEYTNPDSENIGEFAVEFSCEPLLVDGEAVDGVVLTYDYGTAVDSWEDSSGDWIDVVNSISFQGDESNAGEQESNDSTGDLASGVYVDSFYFFSVSWDPDIYESTLLVDESDIPYGVILENDLEYGSIAAGGYSSPRGCLTERSDEFALVEGVTNFEEADDLEWPKTNPESRAALYRYDYENPDTGDRGVFLQYFDCQELLIDGEPVDDVVLTFDMGILEEEYASALPAWEGILASVEWDVEPSRSTDPEPESNGTPTTGVDGNQYLDPEYGWGLSWDTNALVGEEWILDEEIGPIGVQLTSDAGDFITIYAHEAPNERRCLSNQIDMMDGSAFTDFEEVIDVDLPDTSLDARAGLFQGIFTSSSGEEVPIFFYAECRPMVENGEEVEDVFLAVNLITFVDNWDDQLNLWSDVLSAIAFDVAGQGRDEPDRNTGGDSQSGIDGDSYISALGYQLGWNDSLYTAELLDEDSPDRGITITSEGSYITVQVVGDPTLRACVDAEANVLEGLDGMSPLTASREAGPTTPADAESAMYEGEVEFSSGTTSDVIVYIECRPLRESEDTPLFIVVSMIGFGDGFADELQEWQAILDSIELLRD